MLPKGYILFKRYKVIKTLGQGGQSTVYLLEDLHLKGKKWVAKEMSSHFPDPKDQTLAQKHFEREAHILANLEHPNLPKVIDYFLEGGKYYLVMEYIEGTDLETLLNKRGKPFSEEQVAQWAIQIATVLYFLHCQNPPIIFRDVKPSNIMITGGQVKLIDFGIARHFNPSKVGDTLRIGSPGYSPPEQYSGQTDPRSDIYSLGVTMHQLLTGYDPTKSNTPFKIPPIKELSPKVSDKMAKIVERAMALDPKKRYPNALSLKKDLKAFLGSSKTAVTKPPTQPKASTTKSIPKEEGKPTSQKKPRQKVKPLLLILLFLVLLSSLWVARDRFVNLLYVLPKFKKSPSPSSSSLPSPSPSISIKPTPKDKGIALYDKGSYCKAIPLLKKAFSKNRSWEYLILLNNSYALGEGKDTLPMEVSVPPLNDKAKRELLRGLSLFQESLNREGGIFGKKIVLNIKESNKGNLLSVKVLNEKLSFYVSDDFIPYFVVPLEDQVSKAVSLLKHKCAKRGNKVVLLDDSFVKGKENILKRENAKYKGVNVVSFKGEKFLGGEDLYGLAIILKRQAFCKVLEKARSSLIFVPPYVDTFPPVVFKGPAFIFTPLSRGVRGYKSANFRYIYREKFKSEPNIISAYGYDILGYVIHSLKMNKGEKKRFIGVLGFPIRNGNVLQFKPLNWDVIEYVF